MYKKMYNRIRIPVKSGSLWYFISKWKKSHCKHHYIHKYSIIALEVSESVLFIIATILSVSSNRKSPTFVSLTLRNSLFHFGIGCLRATVQKQTRKETKSFDLETHGLICIFFRSITFEMLIDGRFYTKGQMRSCEYTIWKESNFYCY